MLARFVWIFGGALLVPGAVRGQDPVETLNANEVQELFQWMSTYTVAPEVMSQEALNRAALLGLLQSGRTGAVLLSKNDVKTESVSPTALLVRLGAHAAYFRPGGLAPEDLKPAAAFLRELPKEVDVLILELRTPRPPERAAGAAALCSLFLPDRTPLFSLQSSTAAKPIAHGTQGAPVWERRVWLLIDERTPPVLELAGHLLSRLGEGQLFGSTTSGTLNETTDRPLGPDHVLRLPSANIWWPDGTRLTGTPLVPPAMVSPVPASREALLAITDPAALAAHLIEIDRPRLNEAALLAGINPEYAVKSSSVMAHPDPVLQQASDLLETAAFLHLDAAVEIKRAEPGAQK